MIKGPNAPLAPLNEPLLIHVHAVLPQILPYNIYRLGLGVGMRLVKTTLSNVSSSSEIISMARARAENIS